MGEIKACKLTKTGQPEIEGGETICTGGPDHLVGLHILGPFTLTAADKTGNWGAFGQQASL